MPGNGSFDERINFLSDQVGTGWITAGVHVNQPYAQDQHENMSYRHDDGRDHYLGGPLMENAFNLVDGIARAVIVPEGSRLAEEMRDIADDMSRYVLVNAPKLSTDLSRSGSPYVTDNGVEIYRKAPLAARDNTPESGWDRR